METKQKLILIVDDQPINRRIIQKILEPEYRVIEAANGREGLERLQQNPKIAAVLLDIMMPVMNGYEFLAALRESDYGNLPTIVMTGERDPDSEKKALDDGAWDFVTKPFQGSVLQSRLKNAIARSEVTLYEQMQYLSEHDTLTGMYSRRKMFAEVRRMIDEHPETRFVFLRLDIDHFRLFNTAFGEKNGDKLLCRFAELISETAKDFAVSICGKMDADVFCVCEPYEAEALQRQVKAICAGLAQYKKDYLLELSCGAYVVEEAEQSVENMYICASMATQKCKHQYGSFLAYYDKVEGRRSEQEVELTSEMQTALAEKQFVIYFQPKFKLSNDTAFGAEALVRWQHPSKGLIPPGTFIPVFEKNGFIAKLDYYVWEETCLFLRQWIDKGNDPFPVSVNISRISLYNPRICQMFMELVEKYGLPPALLHLEITESAYMSNPELMRKTIRSLHKAGFTIMMDDFGSGYSSLNTLKEIEVDILKFDMKFLPTHGDIAKGEIILVSTIRMANWLGMTVVVEGVETVKQRDFLEGIGCDYVQGYYYAKPMPASEYESEYVAHQQEAAQKKSKVALPVTKLNKQKDTILVIDDDEINRELLHLYLEEKFNIIECTSAEEGISFLRKNGGVRLILIDNYMEGMSGLDFLEFTKSIPSLSSIPEIMITASDNAEDQIKAFRRGAYDYITKPLVKEVVLARVEHALDLKQQMRKVENAGKEYKSLAERDAMTGLYNKATSKKLCVHTLEGSPDDMKALLIIDIDNFKSINDEYGHLVGDDVIRSVANALKSSFRKSDIVGRYGGDEFVVMMNELPGYDTSLKKANDIIKSIHFACSQKLQLAVSISVGVAFANREDIFDSLFARADQALYEAKNSGKGKASVYGENVPAIEDDNKPIILVCGENPQLYPAIALAYGSGCAFANITSYKDLREAFEEYRERIGIICMDMQKKVMHDADIFYEFILQNGGGSRIPIIAVCQDGDMVQLRQALELQIMDVITMPPQIDTIRKRFPGAFSTWKSEAGRGSAIRRLCLLR